MNIQELKLDELCEFLTEAKKETFAKGGQSVSSRSSLSKNYLYEKDSFRYEDRFFGDLLDVGQEIVWLQEFPIWGMGYRGGMLASHRDFASETFKVLKSALRNPEVGFPIRGPRKLVKDKFEYNNNPVGDITSFTGSEDISFEDQIVYFRNYVGGLIVGKYNKNMEVNNNFFI